MGEDIIIMNTPSDLTKGSERPLLHPGVTPDSARLEKPPLPRPTALHSGLSAGDRVEALGNFGKALGEFGTVEQINDDDAIVKWDNGGRMTLRYPWLTKV